MGILFLLAIASILLLPACGSSTPTNSPTGATTPKNTYTFTLTGTDENGATPSNATTAEATVSVTVN
jgi:ABC-type glycerol-3-phosphate transport system substrate-binding protein